MTVYVDDMFRYQLGRLGRMKMSHLIADTDAELHAMADRIGVARKWHQGDHYDIAISKRKNAIAAGAIEITITQCSAMDLRRRKTGFLGSPEDAEEWARAFIRERLNQGRAIAAAGGTP